MNPLQFITNRWNLIVNTPFEVWILCIITVGFIYWVIIVAKNELIKTQKEHLSEKNTLLNDYIAKYRKIGEEIKCLRMKNNLDKGQFEKDVVIQKIQILQAQMDVTTEKRLGIIKDMLISILIKKGKEFKELFPLLREIDQIEKIAIVTDEERVQLEMRLENLFQSTSVFL